MTAPRTSPLTEEEARKIARGISRHIHGEDHGETIGVVKAALLRVDSEAHDRGARAALEMQTLCNEAMGAQLLDVQQDCIAWAIKCRAAEADLDEAVRLLDEAMTRLAQQGAFYPALIAARDALLARHPTPSTPTTEETEADR